MTVYATTADILIVDPSSAQLCATPDAPDFTAEITWISSEIDEILRNQYPGLTTTDIETVAQLKPLCVHMVLENLYVNATFNRNDAAQFKAEYHRKMAQTLMKRRIDLANGEKKNLLCSRVVRG